MRLSAPKLLVPQWSKFPNWTNVKNQQRCISTRALSRFTCHGVLLGVDWGFLFFLWDFPCFPPSGDFPIFGSTPFEVFNLRFFWSGFLPDLPTSDLLLGVPTSDFIPGVPTTSLFFNFLRLRFNGELVVASDFAPGDFAVCLPSGSFEFPFAAAPLLGFCRLLGDISIASTAAVSTETAFLFFLAFFRCFAASLDDTISLFVAPSSVGSLSETAGLDPVLIKYIQH